jgi:hypothetical protein
MQDRIAEVELIPWRHDVNLQAHQDLIQAVRNLPRNSILLLEITQNQIDEFNSYLANHREDLNLSQYRQDLRDSRFAVYEIYLECLRRGIKVIPIEESVYRRRLEKQMNAVDDWYDVSFSNFKREEIMTRRIIEASKMYAGQKISVICGARHIPKLANRFRLIQNIKLTMKPEFTKIVQESLVTDQKRVDALTKENIREVYLRRLQEQRIRAAQRKSIKTQEEQKLIREKLERQKEFRLRAIRDRPKLV